MGRIDIVETNDPRGHFSMEPLIWRTALPDPEHTTTHPPSERKKGKAAIFVVAIVVALILVIFVGRNFWHATEDTDPQGTSSPHSAVEY